MSSFSVNNNMEMFIMDSPSSIPSIAKFASTNSIPISIEESATINHHHNNNIINYNNNNNNEPQQPTVIFRESKGRRHSVLDDLRARRDSFFSRARRGSIFDEKENNKLKEPKETKEIKEKRRSSEGNQRRSSVFYVTDDLLEENHDVVFNEKEKEKLKKGRRKSWHPLANNKTPKTDRKRKKGLFGIPSDVGSTEAIYAGRQKRLSWWNIFVPDSVSRSRRLSQQDVTHSRSTENLPAFRSKSRSVDHGFTTPYDLESLRSKVEGRFESVDKLTRDSEGEGKDGSTLQEKKQARLTQPENTTAYTVGERDTLTSVAARFDTTPSELSKLNRLGSTFVYPGQKLWVPTKGEARSGSQASQIDTSSPDPSHDHDSQDDLPPEEKELLGNLRPSSPKPGHMERVKTPLDKNNEAMNEETPAYRERFLKINVRHITDGQGVVGGVLLVTPNAVMFDPNVSDPLVIEHGAESYGVIAPMEFVVNAAIYYDIAHMRVSHTDNCSADKKPEIYFIKKPTTDRKCLSPGKDENFSELTVDDNESVCSCAERDGDAFPKAFERDLVTPTNLQNDEGSSTEKEKDKNLKKDKIEETGDIKKESLGMPTKTLEERRRSMLDHHWAVPSKDRLSFSVDEEQQDSVNSDKMTEPPKPSAIPEGEEGSLVKQSCYDSGIDIREPNPPIPVVQPIPSKKVYSDADIVLSSDWVPPLTIVPTNVSGNSLEANLAINGRKKASSVSFSLDSNAEEPEKIEETKEEEKQGTKKNKMMKRLSYPLSLLEGFTTEKEDDKSLSDKVSSQPNSADSHHSSVFSKVFSRRSSTNAIGIAGRQNTVTSSGNSSMDSGRGHKQMPPKLDYRSMVSVDDMPELFVSFDKLIPRPARSCEDPPLYLRLRTGRPKDKKIPRSTPIMSYGKKKLRPEYWFSVPRNRVDDLYKFIHAWVPTLYGELDENYWQERGYILSDTDTDMSPEMSPQETGETGESGDDKKSPIDSDDITDLTRESWEVLSMSEELRRALYANSAISLDIDVIVPDLVGATEILSDEHRENLCRHLPARAEGYLWTLVFSTSQHGFSLNSMYRKMAKVESPILLVIEDTEGNVFGAITSCSLRVSDLFYGTGESLLFRFTPKFQAFNWTGDNLYFIKGNNESLAIGAGDGKFGLWLDGDLYQGRTQTCSTYGNEPLAPHEDFVVKTLECWAFI